MNVIFDSDVAVRLAEIEINEDVAIEDFVRQAVGVWCRLEAGERIAVGMYALQLVTRRNRT